MKKLITLLFFVILTITTYAQGAPFVTRWNLSYPGFDNDRINLNLSITDTVTYSWQELSPGNDSGFGIFTSNYENVMGLPPGSIIRLSIDSANINSLVIGASSSRSRLIDIESWGSMNWTSMYKAFVGCNYMNISATNIPNISGLTDMSHAFSACDLLTGPINISSWNTAQVTSMFDLFYKATNFNQPIGSWNTSAVTNMRSVFSEASIFNQDISNWNTASVYEMAEMFAYTNKFNKPIGDWITDSVHFMQGMFRGAVSFNQPLGNWNTLLVENMGLMFCGAIAFNQSIGNWQTASVTDMRGMFSSAKVFNQPLDNWNTAEVRDMAYMFAGATAFNQTLGNWTLNSNVILTSMLDTCGLDCNNYSNTLIGWAANPNTPNGRTLGALNMQYNAAGAAARATLISKGWTITGDAPSTDPAQCLSTIGITDPTTLESLQLSPNPFTNHINLSLAAPTASTLQVSISNTLGQIVYVKQEQIASGLHNQTIILDNIPAGIYMVKVALGNRSATNKLVHY